MDDRPGQRHRLGGARRFIVLQVERDSLANRHQSLHRTGRQRKFSAPEYRRIKQLLLRELPLAGRPHLQIVDPEVEPPNQRTDGLSMVGILEEADSRGRGPVLTRPVDHAQLDLKPFRQPLPLRMVPRGRDREVQRLGPRLSFQARIVDPRPAALVSVLRPLEPSLLLSGARRAHEQPFALDPNRGERDAVAYLLITMDEHDLELTGLAEARCIETKRSRRQYVARLSFARRVDDQRPERRQRTKQVRLAARVGPVDADDAEQVTMRRMTHVASIYGFVAPANPRLGLEAERDAIAERPEVGDAELDEHGAFSPHICQACRT